MAGQSIGTFWEQTPATFDAVMRGHARRERAAVDTASYQAWQTARLGHWDPAKFPRLEKLLSRPERAERRRMTGREMYEAMKAHMARQGRR